MQFSNQSRVWNRVLLVISLCIYPARSRDPIGHDFQGEERPQPIILRHVVTDYMLYRMHVIESHCVPSLMLVC